MLRGIFMPGGVQPAAVNYYTGLFKKVMDTAEWKAFMEQGAFNQTTLTGKEYADWVAREEARHVSLMKGAGFIAGSGK
jgi:tripartite-type tricarboxylate transporter receptor subunit TctC